MNIDPHQEGDLHEIGSWRKLLVRFLLYLFSGAAGTKYHRRTGLNNRRLSRSPGSWKMKVKVSAGPPFFGSQ